MRLSRPRRSNRRIIAAAVVLLGLFNVASAMLPARLVRLGQFRHLIPGDAVNGGRFVLLMLGILLVAVAPGLWTGKRAAWGIAFGCCLGSIAAHSVKNVDLWGMSASVAMVIILAASRNDFPARSDPPTARRGLIMLAGGLVFVYLYSTLGLYFLDREFVHHIPFLQALRDSLRLMFILPATEAAPRTRHGTWLVDSVRVAFLFVMVLGLSQLVRPVIYHTYTTRRERDRVRALLKRYANSSIAHFALLPDKLYFFSDEGNAVIAYKTVGANAIAMGDPIGREEEFPRLISAFQAYCELNGWAHAFHQARPEYLPLYEAQNLKHLKIGEEAVVPTAEFSLEGHDVKRLRSTIARFEREGYRTEVLLPPHRITLLRRLREISDEWLALGKRRERTFTLGYFDESLLQECDIMVARAPDSQIVAFATIIPSYNMPEGNFDMVRYSGELHGLSDFLHVSLINHFRDQGRPGMNLGLAPFSGIDPGGVRSPVGRAMRMLYSYGGFLFRAKGLREFKGKYRPRWEPRYLVYSSDLQLPGIALAVARAGELRDRHRRLGVGTVEARRPPLRELLSRYLRLFPGAIIVTAAMLAISLLTTMLAVDSLELTNKIGLTLDGLRAGHIWLIPAATLAQPETVMKWVMPIWVFFAIALLEYQAGTLRAVVTFFASDWLGALLLLLGLWALGGIGWAGAAKLASTGDTGSSAAVFGGLTAASVLLRRPWRGLLFGGIVAYLFLQFTFEDLDAAISHVVAAIIGVVIAFLWLRRGQIRQINTSEFWPTRLLTWTSRLRPQGRLWRYAKLFPGAIIIAAVTLAVSATTTALRLGGPEVTNKVGLTLDGLRAGHLWLIPASTLAQPGPAVRWVMPGFVFVVVALLEYQVGTIRALVAFFLSDWIASPLMVLLLWGLGAAGWSEAKQVASRGDAGTSAAALGTLVAATLLLRQPWRNLVLAGTAFFLGIQWSFSRLDSSTVHTLGSMVGAVIALVWLRSRRLRDIDTDEFWLTRFLTRAWQTVRRQS